MKINVRRAECAALIMVAAFGLLACNGGESDAAANSGEDDEINLMRSRTAGGVVAYVDGDPITFDEMLREAQAELNQIEIERFRMLQGTIDRILARRLVGRAAAAEGLEAEDWLAREVDKRVPEPTANAIEEMLQRYARHPSMAGKTPEEKRETVRSEMMREDVRDAHIAIFEQLKAASDFESFLDPPRIDVEVPDGEPSWGPDDAPVTVVEFSDFQCEFCRGTHSAVQAMLAEFGDRVRFVYRDFAPANHPRALPAARAARCAGDQSRYWDYHDVLWTKTGNLSDDDLIKRAESLALDMSKFRECFESDRHREEVAQSWEDSRKLGVSGTPTFFVNGVVLQGSQTFETLKVVIEDELKAAGA